MIKFVPSGRVGLRILLTLTGGASSQRHEVVDGATSQAKAVINFVEGRRVELKLYFFHVEIKQ